MNKDDKQFETLVERLAWLFIVGGAFMVAMIWAGVIAMIVIMLTLLL